MPATLTGCQLVVPGQPVPNARARRGQRGWYTPRSTTEYRERVRTAWMVEGRPWLGEGPLEVELVFVFERPRSHFTATGQLRTGAPEFPAPDGDNLEKAVLDALSDLAYKDDCQVVAWRGAKLFAEGGEPYTQVDLRAV